MVENLLMVFLLGEIIGKLVNFWYGAVGYCKLCHRELWFGLDTIDFKLSVWHAMLRFGSCAVCYGVVLLDNML